MQIYRHKKRGTEYRVLHVGTLQTSQWVDKDTDHSIDMEEVVIYQHTRNPDEIWVRSVSEFYDGRFVRVDEKDEDDDYYEIDESGYSRADEEWFFDHDGKP